MRALRAVHRRVWGPTSYDATYGARARRAPHAQRTRAAGLGAIALGGLLVLLGLAPAAANATQPNPDHKVTLCHRTDSYSNPYVRITVDVASVLHNGHDGHNGPVFFPAIPKHEKWGDIIPPFDFGPGESYAGKNWTPAGIAVFDNGCAIPSSPTTSTSTATSSTIPSTTTTVLATSTTAPRGGGSTTTTSEPVPGSSTTISSVTTTSVSTVTVGGSTSTTEPPVGTTVLGGTVASLGGGGTTVASENATSPVSSTSLPFTGSSAEPLIVAGLVLVAAGLGLTRRRNSSR
jgi:hypothetical protein